MAFIPHTEQDVASMLAAIGVRNVEQLFEEIPDKLRVQRLDGVPSALNEMEIGRLMESRAKRDGRALCFIGAGAYEHHIPSAVWAITTRGEFYSAYTPYQAEASQGTLQLLYEYQSMMASLTGMEVSNASLYDGASAVAEACRMAMRINRTSKSQRFLMPSTVHPCYRRVLAATLASQGLCLESVPYDVTQGRVPIDALVEYDTQDITGIIVQQPNFLGVLEDVDALTDWAHARGILVIAVVNPTSLALLKPPGEWGSRTSVGCHGADIAVGEGQPLGVPLSSGGPYFGFLTARMEHARQMPGRVVGRTLDAHGEQGFTLTLQAREQHIRRAKATSNICTNQGLLVTAATIYMSLMGPQGLRRVAAASHANTCELVAALTRINGVRGAFSAPHFHESVLLLDRPAASVLAALEAQGVLGGFDLIEDYPELGPALLVCATETKTAADIDAYARALAIALASAAPAKVRHA
jgi:glycine dehydrogenase subunit 1